MLDGDQTELDVNLVRAHFPAFASHELKGQAFFENAGGSYACRFVTDRLARFYRVRKVQPYGPYPASVVAGAEMDEARRRISAMLGVAEDELSFGPSTSQNTYVLSQAFRRLVQPGDAIVVTDQDHEANSGVWRRLAEDGIEVREWRMDPETGHLDPAALAALLDERVRLVCFPHCSNIVGEINPVRQIADMAHDVGAHVCVDGVSYAPHGFPDVSELGADIYLFSAYKTYGPHQGIMVVRRALAEVLPAQCHWFNAADPVKRFTPAGPDHAQVAAAAGIAEYVDTVYAQHVETEAEPVDRARVVAGLMRRRETALLEPLLAWLRDRPGIRLLGPTEAAGRAPTVAVELDEPGEAAAARLAGHGIMCAGGDFYAVRTLKGLGVDPSKGVLRLSFVHYTHEREIERLVEALDREI